MALPSSRPAAARALVLLVLFRVLALVLILRSSLLRSLRLVVSLVKATPFAEPLPFVLFASSALSPLS